MFVQVLSQSSFSRKFHKNSFSFHPFDKTGAYYLSEFEMDNYFYEYFELANIEGQMEVEDYEIPAVTGDCGQETSLNQSHTHCIEDQPNVLPFIAPPLSQCNQNLVERISVVSEAVTSEAARECPQQLRSSTVNQGHQSVPENIAPKLSKVTKRRAIAAKSQNNNFCRPGKITKNPFVNFIREVRKTLCGHRQADVIKEAAHRWRTMTIEEKRRFDRAWLVKGRN